MDKRREILSRVKRFRDQSRTLVNLQSTSDIIHALVVCHREEAPEYDKICMLFDQPTAYATGKDIWVFIKGNIHYFVEKDEYQTVRTPGAIVATGKSVGADCKNYSLFTAGIIDGLNRQGAGIPWCFRFASYDPFDPEPQHVFVVMYPKSSEEIWIDAVLDEYDEHKQPCYYKDRYAMLAKVSGIPSKTMGSRRTLGAFIGQGDGDDIDDNDFDPTTVDDDVNPSNGSTGDNESSSSFNLSALPSDQVSNDTYITSSGTDTTDAGSILTSPSGASASSSLSAEESAEAGSAESGNLSTGTTSSGNVFTNLVNSLFGGGSSGSGGAGSSGGGTGSTAAQKSSGSGSGTTINVSSGQSSVTNYTPWIIGGAAAILLIVVLTSSKNK